MPTEARPGTVDDHHHSAGDRCSCLGDLLLADGLSAKGELHSPAARPSERNTEPSLLDTDAVQPAGHTRTDSGLLPLASIVIDKFVH